MLFTTLIALLWSTSFSTDYFTRTAYVHVESSNDIMDVRADNYQVNSTLDLESGEISFSGLLKSFEFELGLANRLLQGERIDVREHPKFTFEGTISGFTPQQAATPGIYGADITGVLSIWGYERLTSTTGQIEVLADGRLKAKSTFTMRIEEESMKKINDLMRQYLPSQLNVTSDQLGVSRNIEVEVSMTYRSI